MRRPAKKPANPEDLLKRMAGLCARSEQCTFDINTKLYKAGLNREQREEIIEYLTANRYLDDGRYARIYASYKVRFSSWGRLKIRAMLATKRIASSLISEALDNIEESDYDEALKRVADSLKRELNYNGERELYVKIYRRMLARGFESDQIKRYL